MLETPLHTFWIILCLGKLAGKISLPLSLPLVTADRELRGGGNSLGEKWENSMGGVATQPQVSKHPEI